MADCILMQLEIKLALESNLQVCNPIAKTAPNLHWIKLAKLAIPVSRLGPGCRPRNQAFWGFRRLAGLVYMHMHTYVYKGNRNCTTAAARWPLVSPYIQPYIIGYVAPRAVRSDQRARALGFT